MSPQPFRQPDPSPQDPQSSKGLPSVRPEGEASLDTTPIPTRTIGTSAIDQRARLQENPGFRKADKRPSIAKPTYVLALMLSVVLVCLSHPALWHTTRTALWFPPIGIGFALLVWVGYRSIPVTLLGILGARLLASIIHGPELALWDISLWIEIAVVGLELFGGWWLYRRLGGSDVRILEPRSATLFLVVVPVCTTAVGAGLQTALNPSFSWDAFSYLWLAKAVGVLAILPALVGFGTPIFIYYKWLNPKPPADFAQSDPLALFWPQNGDQTPWPAFGNWLEILGLGIGAGIVAGILCWENAGPQNIEWRLWAVMLLLTVWASLRQGLRGAVTVALTTSVVAWFVVGQVDPNSLWVASFQGILFAQGSTGFLVGASSSWLRANEVRYRTFVGHIPVMLYSARIRTPASADVEVLSDASEQHPPSGEDRPEPQLPGVQIVLVSSAANSVFGCDPDSLVGSFQAWLARVHPEDRELLLAALAQLRHISAACQRSRGQGRTNAEVPSVTCEYRLNPDYFKSSPAREQSPAAKQSTDAKGTAEAPPVRAERWVRDTLAPNLAPDGTLTGWEGVVEDISSQRVLAQDLQRTTTMLHTLVANLPAGVVFVQGTTGQPVLVNARARHLLGQREAPSAGIAQFPRVYRLHRPDGSLYPCEDLPVYKALYSGVTSMRDDIVIHRPDGRYVPLVTWAAPVDLEGDGAVGNGQSSGSRMASGAVWVFEDLTSLQQAEAARMESEIRIRTIIETMAEGLVLQNDQGTVIECNAAASVILGRPEKELIGQSSLRGLGACLREDGTLFSTDKQPDLVCARTREPVRGVVMGVIGASDIPVSSAHLNTSVIPVVRWLLVNCMPLTSGQPSHPGFTVRIITTFVDITEQRASLSHLRASEEQYRALIETLPLMVIQVDQDFQIRYRNPRTQDVFGGVADAETFLDRVAANDRDRVETWLQAIVQGGEIQNDCEFGLQDQGGEFRSCYALAYPVASRAVHPRYVFERGQATRVCTLVIADLTHERHLEREMRRVQKLEMVGRLAGGIVHDFNNLLTPIVALAQLAQQRQPDDPDLQSDLKTIEEAGKQAAQLAARLLSFSRNRRPNISSVVTPVSMRTVVTRTLDLVRPTIGKTIDVETNFASANDCVLADEGQLHQILVNLCLNGKDAMPQGGRLTVRTEITEDEGILLSIEDTGEGMAPEIQEKIFDPFFSTKERGTGLGLAVVAQLVESFRGQIYVQSEPGVGTRFDIWLPRASGVC